MIIAAKLTELILDPRLDMRVNREQTTIDEYAEAIFDLPPGNAIKGPNGQLWLWDGWTRYKAHEKMGLGTMRVEVQEGTFLEALGKAAGSNEGHGVRRTDADKRRAVKAILAEPEWSDKSDRAIAETCKVSHVFVAKVRKRIAEQREEQAQGKAGNRGKGRPKKNPDDKRKPFRPRESPGKRCARCTRVCPPGQSVPNCEACKALKASNGKPAQEREILVDAAGKVVPAHLEPIFATVPLFKEGANLCRRLKDIFKQIEASPHKKKLLQKTHYELLSIVILRVSQRLDALCPHIATHGLCDGNGCPTCQNDGWQSREEYNAEKKTI